MHLDQTTPAVSQKSRFCGYCQKARTPAEMREVATVNGKRWRCTHCGDRSKRAPWQKGKS